MWQLIRGEVNSDQWSVVSRACTKSQIPPALAVWSFNFSLLMILHAAEAGGIFS